MTPIATAIGSPLEASTLVGPLIHESAYRAFELALEKASADGGTVVIGGERTLAWPHPTRTTLRRRS